MNSFFFYINQHNRSTPYTIFSFSASLRHSLVLCEIACLRHPLLIFDYYTQIEGALYLYSRRSTIFQRINFRIFVIFNFFLLKWNVLLICLTHRIFQIRFLITEKKNKFKKRRSLIF